MHVLFLALTIYLLGSACVLYLRPALMFQPGGTWKEFSLTPGPNHSYMPFWLFTIIWSFVSYLLASFIQRYTTFSSMENDFEMTDTTPQTVLETDFEQIAEPVSKSMGLNTTQNGFYVLNTAQTAKNRAPMYVYYGDQPPSGFIQQ